MTICRHPKKGESLKAGAKRKGFECNFDLKWLIERYNHTDGKCEIIGIKFRNILLRPEKSHTKSWNSLSFDRIDSNKGYTKENTRLVLEAVNMFLGQLDDIKDKGIIINVAKQIVEYYSKLE